MDKRFDISSYSIKYHVDVQSSIGDTSWEILIKDIKKIGIVNRMLGDDDSRYLIFVDSNLKKYFITLNNSIQNFNEFESFLSKNFKIDLKVFYSNHYDEAIIIYPKELFGKKFYKNSSLLRIARFFGFVHTAEGELNDKVKEFIAKKNSLSN